MKALVKQDIGAGNVSIQDVEAPQITRKDEIKVAVKAAGICGTDIEILHGRDPLFRPPVIFGHEFSGEIIEMGKDVEKFTRGDRVVFESTVQTCGQCRYCREGKPNLCSTRLIAGFNTPGGFAEFSIRRQRYVHRLPDTVSFAAGALCEPLAVATHAVLELTPITPGEIVVVIGPGPIGLLCLQLVNAAGARSIVVGTTQDANRLNLARELGTEFVIDINKEQKDLARLVDDLTDGYGVDVVFGCTGAPPAFTLGVDLLRKGGRYNQIGLFTKEIPFPIDKMSYRELKLQGSFAQKTLNWERALSLLGRGLVDTLPLVTTLPMSRWEEGFALAEKKEAIKVVLEPEK